MFMINITTDIFSKHQKIFTLAPGITPFAGFNESNS